MTSLRTPRYLKISDIQSMLRYIFLNDKRPHFVQLLRKPNFVSLIRIKNEIYKGNGSSLTYGELQSLFLKLGITLTVHINENIELDYIFNNILRSIDIGEVDLSVTTPQTLDLIEKHDVNHLFSYSTFIKSKTTFNSAEFDSYVKPNKKTKYFLIAVDCEMLMTMDGKQLGRVTLVDHLGNVVYDRYIKPRAYVTDYIEKYSGLNYHNTSNGISFDQLQNDILEYIGTETYVLGHGLENDLESMKLYTDKVIDTAYLFLNSEGFKIKLSQLALKFFKQKIQVGSHSSREDSICCLKLLAYKIMQIIKFHDDKSPNIDLQAEVRRIDKIEELRNVQEKRVVNFLEIDGIEKDKFNENIKNFLVFFYTFEGKNYIAFKAKM